MEQQNYQTFEKYERPYSSNPLVKISHIPPVRAFITGLRLWHSNRPYIVWSITYVRVRLMPKIQCKVWKTKGVYVSALHNGHVTFFHRSLHKIARKRKSITRSLSISATILLLSLLKLLIRQLIYAIIMHYLHAKFVKHLNLGTYNAFYSC